MFKRNPAAAFRLLPFITRDHWFMKMGYMGNDEDEAATEESETSSSSESEDPADTTEDEGIFQNQNRFPYTLPDSMDLLDLEPFATLQLPSAPNTGLEAPSLQPSPEDNAHLPAALRRHVNNDPVLALRLSSQAKGRMVSDAEDPPATPPSVPTGISAADFLDQWPLPHPGPGVRISEQDHHTDTTDPNTTDSDTDGEYETCSEDDDGEADMDLESNAGDNSAITSSHNGDTTYHPVHTHPIEIHSPPPGHPIHLPDHVLAQHWADIQPVDPTPVEISIRLLCGSLYSYVAPFDFRRPISVGSKFAFTRALVGEWVALRWLWSWDGFALLLFRESVHQDPCTVAFPAFCVDMPPPSLDVQFLTTQLVEGSAKFYFQEDSDMATVYEEEEGVYYYEPVHYSQMAYYT
ncbi:hypothetical protein R3P38DRAFT_2805637 [Favolaschia claudopus]|uniref:Uncharacterized protein n=1 Tax=Favolaschia claudopus TaxID=2862362 RepID=A0AAV9ZN09_9AGAR